MWVKSAKRTLRKIRECIRPDLLSTRAHNRSVETCASAFPRNRECSLFCTSWDPKDLPGRMAKIFRNAGACQRASSLSIFMGKGRGEGRAANRGLSLLSAHFACGERMTFLTPSKTSVRMPAQYSRRLDVRLFLLSRKVWIIERRQWRVKNGISNRWGFAFEGLGGGWRPGRDCLEKEKLPGPVQEGMWRGAWIFHEKGEWKKILATPCLFRYCNYTYWMLIEYAIASYSRNRSFATAKVRFEGSSECRTEKQWKKHNIKKD